VAHPPHHPTRREQSNRLRELALSLKHLLGIAPILAQDVGDHLMPLMEWWIQRAASRQSTLSSHLQVCLVSLRIAALLPPLVGSIPAILALCYYGQRPDPQKTPTQSGKTNHSFSTLRLQLTARVSHTLLPSTLLPAAFPLLQCLQRQLISNYKRTYPPQTHLSLSTPLTDSLSPFQGSNTNSTYQPHVRQTTHIEISNQAESPTVSPMYSSNPTVNPNPLHLNPPMPRDEFYQTLDYFKPFNATMMVGKILSINELEMLQDDTPPPFIRESTEEPSLKLPDHTPDLQPTKMQKEIQHHPYIDAVPFEGFHGMLLECIEKGEETGNYVYEVNASKQMYESWGVWGEYPWEGRNLEIGEAFAR